MAATAATTAPSAKLIPSAAGVEIITKPFLVGPELEALSLESSKDFVRALDAAGVDIENCVSLEILNGGHYYFVGPAYEAVKGKACPIASLRAKRGQDEETGAWKVRVWDRNDVSVSTGATVLIGDTVATGTTLGGVLSWVVDEMEAASTYGDIRVFAIAGARTCEDKLIPAATRLKANGKELTIHFANAAFNLADNGTDLGFTGAEYAEGSEAAIAEVVGDFSKHMKCAVWDWGDRFRLQHDHLKEISEYFSEVESTPTWLSEGIATRLAAAEAAAAGADGEDESKADGAAAADASS